MRALVEAGVVLLIVYLFLEYQKNQVAASGTPLPMAAGSSTLQPATSAASNFVENPGAASDTYETSGGFFLNNTPSPATNTTKQSGGGCGCGG